MTTKHEIEIPDLPEGWRVVAYRIPRQEENYLSIDGLVEKCSSPIYVHRIIVEKIKPRRIVFEYMGIDKPRIGDYIFHVGEFHMCDDPDNFGSDHQIWRVVEEEQ